MRSTWPHGYQLFDGVPDATFTLHSWTVGSAATGTMTVRAPSQLTAGVPEYVTLFFTGLVPGTQYLGSIAYNRVGLPDLTLVNVFAP